MIVVWFLNPNSTRGQSWACHSASSFVVVRVLHELDLRYRYDI